MREESASVVGFEPPSDDADRTRDFFARHGGPATVPPRHGQSSGGLQGWSETQAADGWVLRCEWSRLNEVEEIKYSEILSSKRS
jgi:hypothetical protein